MDTYLNSFRDAEQVYYLNKVGRERVGAIKAIAKNSQYKHTLMRNDIYTHYGCPEMWENEYPIKTEELYFVTDALFMVDGIHYFLEVDNQQKMQENKKKLNNYYLFKNTQLVQSKNNGTFPTLIFYTVTETRKAQLLELNPGLDLIVYTIQDLF